MIARRSFTSLLSALAVPALFLAGCAGNVPHRTKDLSGYVTPFDSCNAAYHDERGFMDVCDQSYYSTYRHSDAAGSYDFDLAFVEFTERGAVFDQNRMNEVIKKIGNHADDSAGVVTVVYVHGWKNNAAPDNGNVRSFREMLAKTAKLQSKLSKENGYEPRKLVGVYVGWRGASLQVAPFHQLSYWDRKSVSEEVGKGGVTELLLRLERRLRHDEQPNKNLYLVTGHSLGASVLLTGLNEIFLERLIDAPRIAEGCIAPTHPFGHGVALINPAIETSEALELKQLVAQNCFGAHQERLMHVISSEADKYTTDIFEAAQWLGLVVGWNQAKFDRTFDLRGPDDEILKDELGNDEIVTIRFDETKMDMTTVGNYEPFLTGYLFGMNSEKAESYGFTKCDDDNDECWIDDPHHCISDPRGQFWNYVPFKRRKDCFSAVTENEDHVPISNHEPLAFIKTDGNFIGDHNDVFNENVAAYLATIVAENRFIRAYADWTNTETRRAAYEGPAACHPKPGPDGMDALIFDFGACFDAYHEAYCKLDESDDGSIPHETCALRHAKS